MWSNIIQVYKRTFSWDQLYNNFTVKFRMENLSLTPANDVISAVIWRPLEERHADQVIEIHSFYEHPHEHGRPAVLQRNVECFTQYRLQIQQMKNLLL